MTYSNFFSPFEILKKLTNKLTNDGFFFIKMGALTQKAPVWQVAHNSVVIHIFQHLLSE